MERLAGALSCARAHGNAALSSSCVRDEPLAYAITGAASALAALYAVRALLAAEKAVRAKGLRKAATEAAINAATALPPVAAYKAKEQAKVRCTAGTTRQRGSGRGQTEEELATQQREC